MRLERRTAYGGERQGLWRCTESQRHCCAGALNLNDTAALIFEQLQAGKTVEETGTALVAAYDVTLETALADVQETINSLREAGVVA